MENHFIDVSKVVCYNKDMEGFNHEINLNTPVGFRMVEITATYNDGQEVTHGAIVMETENGGEVLMHWGNTTIRVFEDCSDGYSIYDHIEVQLDSQDEPLAIRMDAGNEELSDWLVENNYPYNFNPIPDKSSYEWGVAVEQKLGEIAIENFLKDK